MFVVIFLNKQVSNTNKCKEKARKVSYVQSWHQRPQYAVKLIVCLCGLAQQKREQDWKNP